MRILFTVFATIVFLVIELSAQGHWEILPQRPSKANLLGVAVPTPLMAFAVGEHGVIRKTVDTGTTWRFISSGTTRTLRGVGFFDEHKGIIVGDDGIILRTGDEGEIWSASESGITTPLHGVAVQGADTGFAVGSNGVILRTTDHGISWHGRESGTGADLFAVAFVNARTVLAAGVGMVLISHDAGDTWQVTHASAGDTLRAISVIDPQSWRFAGYAGVMLRTDNAGESWERWVTDSRYDFRGLHCFSREIMYATGTNRYDFFDDPAMFYSKDSGRTWESFTVRYAAEGGLATYADSICMLVGRNGTIIRLRRYPLPTERRLGVVAQGPSISYTDVECLDARNCTAIGHILDPVVRGYTALIERTTDGGRTWIQQYGDLPTGRGLNAFAQLAEVCAVDSLRWYIAGDSGVILRTTDGGAFWERLNSGTRNKLVSISFGDARHGLAGGSFGLMLRTSDGGDTWARLDSITPTAVHTVFCHDSLSIFVSSAHTNFLSADGGRSWAPYQDSPTETGSLDFISRDVAWSAGSHKTPENLGSRTNDMITTSTDGGRTWRTVLDREVGDLPFGLQDISFADARNGLAVGRSGKILRTIDRGETWVQEEEHLVSDDEIMAVAFPTPATAVAVTNYGLLLRYHDEGAGGVIGSGSAATGVSIHGYPNPASDRFSIRIAGRSMNSTLPSVVLFSVTGEQVMELAGRVVDDAGEGIIHLNLAGAPCGVYFIRLRLGSLVTVCPLVIQ